MRTVIITEGGRNRGFGHVTRCLSFYEAFKKRGFEATFVVNGDDSVRDLLNGKKNRILNWLKNQKELMGEVKGADVAVVDSYLASKRVYQQISERVRCGVYLDDTQRLDYPKGIVINGALGAEGLRYPMHEGVIYLLGIQYTPLRREFARVPQKKIRQRVRMMLITFGGDDGGLTSRIVSFLNTTYPGIMKAVVVGRGFKKVSEIRKLMGPFTTPIYFPDAQGMKELMLNADVAISGGGQTLYELARVGVPTIAVRLSDNQIMNIDGWRKAGFISYAGWHRDARLLDRLKREVNQLLPYKVRLMRSEAGRKTIDGKGVERAIGRVLDFLNNDSNVRLRKANGTDCYDLWNWRNHPEVRRWSLDKRKIDYESHLEWFQQMLENKSRVIYIAEDGQGQKLGQVRFDRKKEDLALVNINLNPDFINKGLGNRILSKATCQYLRENPKVKKIRAEILEKNAASRKAFQKAGYQFFCSVLKADERIALYNYARD